MASEGTLHRRTRGGWGAGADPGSFSAGHGKAGKEAVSFELVVLQRPTASFSWVAAMVVMLHPVEAPPPIAVSAGVEDLRRSSSSSKLIKRSGSASHAAMRKSASAAMLPPMQGVPMSAMASASDSQLPRLSSFGGFAAAATVLMSPVKLNKIHTGKSLPRDARESIFRNNSKITLTVASSGGSSLATDDELRRRRARRQKEERSERPAKKRGAHVHPPLKSLAPEEMPWHPLPAKAVIAADNFDRRHCNRWDSAEGLYFALSRDSTHLAKQDAIDISLMELRMNRFHVPATLDGVSRYEQKTRKPKARKPWKLAESIWGERARGTGVPAGSVLLKGLCTHTVSHTEFLLALLHSRALPLTLPAPRHRRRHPQPRAQSGATQRTFGTRTSARRRCLTPIGRVAWTADSAVTL